MLLADLVGGQRWALALLMVGLVVVGFRPELLLESVNLPSLLPPDERANRPRHRPLQPPAVSLPAGGLSPHG